MKAWNETLDTIKPYTVASHKIWAVAPEERSRILKLDWNEATVPPSPLVKQRLRELMEQEDVFRLYPSTFNEELMARLAQYTGLPEENIQYFGGSDDLHEYLARAYLTAGDRVLILWPSYDNFRLTAESTGARLYYAELGEDFTFDETDFRRRLEALRPHCTGPDLLALTCGGLRSFGLPGEAQAPIQGDLLRTLPRPAEIDGRRGTWLRSWSVSGTRCDPPTDPYATPGTSRFIL